MTMAKRGRWYEGSVFKRTRRGRVEWVGEITVGFDAEGKRRKRTLYGASMGEVQRKLDEEREKVAQGIDLASGRQKLADYLDHWITTGEERWRSTTRTVYADLIRLHLKPCRIAGKILDALQPADLEVWQAQLRKAGVTPGVRRQAHKLLKAALKAAVRRNRIVANPADRVEPPPVPARDARVVLDRADVLRLLAAAEGHPFEAAVLLAVLHGCRIGEVAGVAWGDLDLRAGVLTVSRQLVEDKHTGKRTRTAPKTESGRREIPLSARAVAALERHRSRLGAIPHPNTLVFTDAVGGPLRPSNFRRRVWEPLRTAAKLPEGCRFHDLRHAHASALLASGVDLTTVSGLLGHSDSSVTLRTYAHALPSRKREAAEKIDALYGS